MSKARELLKRTIYFLEPLDWEANVEQECQDLIKEILAQPAPRQDNHCYWCDGEYDAGARLAQPEQEPVDWEKEKKSYLDEIDRLGVESNRDDEEIDRLTQLLTATDQKPLAWMYDWEDKLKEERMQDRITKIKSMTESPEAFNVRPLYTSPPKREPLSDDDIRNFADVEYIVCNAAFISGVKWAEQQHNIGANP